MSWWEEHLGEALLAVVVTVMGFFGKRELKRIDDLDDKKANKTDIAALLRQLESHIEDDKELRREVSRKFDEFGESLSEVRVSVAKIAGKLGQ